MTRLGRSDAASLARLDAVGQAELCARGDLTADDLVAAARIRIDALDPLLRTIVARPSDGALPRTRIAPASPLAGVPFLAKDSLPWPGMRWSMGARVLRNQVASTHVELGRRLADAGLVCIGKSAMAELGLLASTESLLDGATHHPWDLALSPGGSSGGSAVAVAAGLVPIAHASDGGGSIRTPAALCGVFGFKPSRARTASASLASSDFVGMTSDHCISRSVRDSAAFLAITEDRSGNTPVGFVREPIRRRLRIASWSRTAFGELPEPAVRQAHDATRQLLAELGHVVDDVDPPRYDGPALGDAFYLVSGAAASQLVDALDAARSTPVQEDELEPFTWELVEAFLVAGEDALPRARRIFADAVRTYRDAMAGYDVVLTPTIAREAFPIGHLSPILRRADLLERTAAISGYAPIANIDGGCAMTVPLHTSARGLPVGAHFAARAGSDATLLGLAYELEAAQPWRDRWPPYSIPRLER